MKCHLLLIYATTAKHQQTISWSDCDMQWKVDCIRQPTANHLSGWIKMKLQSTSQSQTCTKKGCGHRLVVSSLIHYSFLNPGKIITSEKYAQQIGEMHQKLQWLQLALVDRMGPIFLHDNTQPHIAQPTLQKLNKLGYKVLPHLSYSPYLSPSDYHFFKHLDNFLLGKCFHKPAGGRKCFPRVHGIPKHGFLCYKNKQTYFLLAKLCWMQWFLFWLIKMCWSLVLII